MAKDRRLAPFWRRNNPIKKHDIALLRPKTLPKGNRFETNADARIESERSEALLRSIGRKANRSAEYLSECRAEHYFCDKPFCPLCSRKFRRWFVGESLRITEQSNGPLTMLTILLEESEQEKIDQVEIKSHRARMRKRLNRAGLSRVVVIGGFEIVYRASSNTWILHVNLLLMGGAKPALERFLDGFKDSGIDRPVMSVPVKDRPEQLSYLLKFTTYHRPYKRRGSSKSRALPLNARDHYNLVTWMSCYEFQDFLFLFDARRKGSQISLPTESS